MSRCGLVLAVLRALNHRTIVVIVPGRVWFVPAPQVIGVSASRAAISIMLTKSRLRSCSSPSFEHLYIDNASRRSCPRRPCKHPAVDKARSGLVLAGLAGINSTTTSRLRSCPRRPSRESTTKRALVLPSPACSFPSVQVRLLRRIHTSTSLRQPAVESWTGWSASWLLDEEHSRQYLVRSCSRRPSRLITDNPCLVLFSPACKLCSSIFCLIYLICTSICSSYIRFCSNLS
ncbi:hypothetical protein F4778DRAFT_652596 [Xylariomycetidae sp. FL2044]|nr:hypothetical protein F4778DRAFT_652596 [Xylariomycetidae sp. FL2044]